MDSKFFSSETTPRNSNAQNQTGESALASVSVYTILSLSQPVPLPNQRGVEKWARTCSSARPSVCVELGSLWYSPAYISLLAWPPTKESCHGLPRYIECASLAPTVHRLSCRVGTDLTVFWVGSIGRADLGRMCLACLWTARLTRRLSQITPSSYCNLTIMG